MSEDIGEVIRASSAMNDMVRLTESSDPRRFDRISVAIARLKMVSELLETPEILASQHWLENTLGRPEIIISERREGAFRQRKTIHLIQDHEIGSYMLHRRLPDITASISANMNGYRYGEQSKTELTRLSHWLAPQDIVENNLEEGVTGADQACENFEMMAAGAHAFLMQAYIIARSQ